MPSTSAAGTTGAWTSEGPVLLCGLGRVGMGVLRLCRRLGKEVIAITLPGRQDQAELGAAVGIRVIAGDARDETLLVRAGIANASALIAVTDDDLANVTIALHARTLAPDIPVVVRLFDQDLAGYLRCVLGIRQGYSTSALAAPSFVAAIRGGNVRTTLDLDGKTWSVEDLEVDAKSPWRGRALSELAATGKAVLVHRRRDEVRFDPPCEHVLVPGDTVTLLVPPSRRPRKLPWHRRAKIVARTARAWWKSTPRGLRFSLYGVIILVGISVGVFHAALGLSPIDAYYFVMSTLSTTGYGDFNLQHAKPLVTLYGTLVMVSGGALFAVIFSVMTDLLLRTRFSDVVAQGTNYLREHIIMAGLGRIGFRVLRQLAHPHQDIVVIEKSAEPRFLGPARSLASVLGGDASAVETLERAGLAGASAVLAVTDDDLTNLSIALATKQARPDCRVVIRVSDQALATRLQKDLRIDAVVSVIDAVAPTFVGAALDRNAVHGTIVHDRLLLFVESDGVPSDARPFLGKGPDGSYRLLEPDANPGPGERVLSARWIALGS